MNILMILDKRSYLGNSYILLEWMRLLASVEISCSCPIAMILIGLTRLAVLRRRSARWNGRPSTGRPVLLRRTPMISAKRHYGLMMALLGLWTVAVHPAKADIVTPGSMD